MLEICGRGLDSPSLEVIFRCGQRSLLTSCPSTHSVEPSSCICFERDWVGMAH